jgi:hypothetical protein
MRIFARIGGDEGLKKTSHDEDDNVAASMMVLVAISGQALAGTTAADARHRAYASTSATAMHAYDAVAPAVAEPNAHRCQGGPKVND